LIVSRFQVSADPNVANASTEESLLKIGQAFEEHNGGGIAFNPLEDGYLYLGTGDGFQFAVAQDGRSLLGKILRLDLNGAPTGAGGAQSVYLDGLASVPVKQFARGLRNPWRFAFDPLLGHLYISDVGALHYEEINVAPRGLEGLNFGWPCLEGPEEYHPDAPGCSGVLANSAQPAYYYSHNFGCAVIGGVVYRHALDASIPPRFIFGDACTRKIFTISDATGEWIVDELGALPPGPAYMTTFGIDADGSVYAGTMGTQSPLYQLQIP
jgi:glucose/arabinose dehydrogenase